MGSLVRRLAGWTTKGIYLCPSGSYPRTLIGLVLCSGRREVGSGPSTGGGKWQAT